MNVEFKARQFYHIVKKPGIKRIFSLFAFILFCSILSSTHLIAQTPNELGEEATRDVLLKFEDEMADLEDAINRSNGSQSEFYSYLREAYSEASSNFNHGSDLKDELASVISGIDRDFITNASYNSIETSQKTVATNSDLVDSILEGKEITSTDQSDLEAIFQEIININQ